MRNRASVAFIVPAVAFFAAEMATGGSSRGVLVAVGGVFFVIAAVRAVRVGKR